MSIGMITACIFISTRLNQNTLISGKSCRRSLRYALQNMLGKAQNFVRCFLLFWSHNPFTFCQWMEDYIHIGWPTLKVSVTIQKPQIDTVSLVLYYSNCSYLFQWGRIYRRGESQAIKIATGFSNITTRLAHAAYYVGSLAEPSVSIWRFVRKALTSLFQKCIDRMNLEFCWYKQLDGVYFEIWKRVAKLKVSSLHYFLHS